LGILNDNAQKILDALPEDGNKISGGVLRDSISMGRKDYDEGKAYLREHGLVSVGRGRGGTICRIIGVALPTEPRKRTKAEIAEFAREAKEAKSAANKKTRERIELITKDVAEELDIDKDRITVTFYGADHRPIIEIRGEHGSEMKSPKNYEERYPI
jgi:hypothetical protein